MSEAMPQSDPSVYRLGRGPALVAVGAFLIAAGLLVFAGFLLAGDTPVRIAATAVVGVLALGSVAMAARFAWRPPMLIRLDAEGFTVGRPRARAAWKQVEDVAIESGFLVLSGDDTARIELRLLEPADRRRLAREVYDRLNTAYGYRRFA
ncbi:MAG: hypothetical protein QM597_06880 [Aeromicrobium sp.]|uniref:hypothetical protein n=1 Tax=Aeromicrobium sp. TaxID=1871063 RepID=UPI0039E35FB5